MKKEPTGLELKDISASKQWSRWIVEQLTRKKLRDYTEAEAENKLKNMSEEQFFQC